MKQSPRKILSRAAYEKQLKKLRDEQGSSPPGPGQCSPPQSPRIARPPRLPSPRVQRIPRLSEAARPQGESIRDYLMNHDRKITGAALTEARNTYAERPVDTDGRVLPTSTATSPSFKYTTSNFEKRRQRRRDQGVERFHEIDADGNGTLDMQELSDGAKVLGISETTARKWFHELDSEGTGEVPMDSFLEKFEEFGGTLEKSEYSLDHRGKTQAEGAEADMQDPGRRLMHSKLEQGKLAYEARIKRDHEGRALPTTARPFKFLFTSRRADENEVRKKKQAVNKFSEIDADGNGTLDVDEIIEGAPLLGLDRDTAIAWFRELDDDKSGTVPMDRFLEKYFERPAGIAKKKYSVSIEETNKYFRDVRKWFGVTGEKERKEFEERAAKSHLKSGDRRLTTVPRGFSFKSDERMAERAERDKQSAMGKFELIDLDGNGVLDLEEVIQGAPVLGISETTAKAWFTELDDGSGNISQEDFLTKYQDRPAGLEPSDVETVSVTDLLKLDRSRREEISALATAESDAFKARMRIRQNIINQRLSASVDRGRARQPQALGGGQMGWDGRSRANEREALNVPSNSSSAKTMSSLTPARRKPPLASESPFPPNRPAVRPSVARPNIRSTPSKAFASPGRPAALRTTGSEIPPAHIIQSPFVKPSAHHAMPLSQRSATRSASLDRAPSVRPMSFRQPGI